MSQSYHDNHPQTNRYKFTAEDRRRGGLSRAANADMRLLGHRGMQAFADRYARGNRRMGELLLVAIGNVIADPCPWNGAVRLPEWAPAEIVEMVRARTGRYDVVRETPRIGAGDAL